MAVMASRLLGWAPGSASLRRCAATGVPLPPHIIATSHLTFPGAAVHPYNPPRVYDGGMNPTLLITGASRGIGAATARLAAARGWDVAVNYTRDGAAAQAVAADVRALGRRALVLQGDVDRKSVV